MPDISFTNIGGLDERSEAGVRLEVGDDRVLRRDRLDVRTGGSKISSDMESTIDPAILRPGRLDVKIEIERPNAQAAEAIFARNLTNEIPIAEGIGSEL